MKTIKISLSGQNPLIFNPERTITKSGRVSQRKSKIEDRDFDGEREAYNISQRQIKDLLNFISLEELNKLNKSDAPLSKDDVKLLGFNDAEIKEITRIADPYPVCELS